MNPTIAYITFRAMLGRRRALLLLALPGILLLLAVALRATGRSDLDISAAVLQRFALGTLLPLLALIAGTGVIGPEIDDGQIMYIVTKPLSRHVIMTTKLVVAIVLVTGFAVIPTVVAGLIMSGGTAGLPVAFGVAALVGGIAYCGVFTLLAVLSRNAVTIGLLYALVWESLVGNFAEGARQLSVQQWALSVADALTSATMVESQVGLSTAVVFLTVLSVVTAVLSAMRLRTLVIAGSE